VPPDQPVVYDLKPETDVFGELGVATAGLTVRQDRFVTTLTVQYGSGLRTAVAARSPR
jgi:hypothetical protein